MDIPNSDIVIPVAIIAVCLLIAWLTYRRTRQKTKGWEAGDLDDAAGVDETLLDIDALDHWHREYGRVVTSWIDAHEGALESLSRSGLQLDLTAESPAVNTQVDGQMRDAVTAHPTPAMRAQLSAMTVAAEATLVAVRRSDYATAERQHLIYIEYRDQWLHRLRQFAPDDTQLGAVEADADRHGADWVLRPVPDPDDEQVPPEPSQSPAETALVTELNASPEAADPWQITRPRRSRRKRRRAG